MPQYYDNEFKKIVCLKLEEGRTAKSIISEYGVSKASITKWLQKFREEYQSNPEAQKDFDSMKEILRLKKELEKIKKENLFLKKQRHSSQRKLIDNLSVYSKISRHIWQQMAFTSFKHLSQCLL